MTEFKLRSHTYDGRYLELSCTQEQNVPENKSLIHWTLTVAGGNANYYTTGPTTVTVNGQTVYYCSTKYWNTYEFPASRGSISGTAEVTHREDGSQTIECTLETSIYTGVMRKAKAAWELDAIPRASTIGATDGFIGGTCMVLVDRKSSLYTHTVALYTDVLEGYLLSDGSITDQPVQLESTTIALGIPLSFYGKIPNEKKLQCRLVCTTYSENTQIGESQECAFVVSCREEDCVPLINGSVEDGNEKTVALTGDRNVLIRFFSRAVCRLDTLGRQGASIVKKQVGTVEIADDVVEIESVETGTFLFQAIDSRGYRAEHQVEMPMIPYRKLTANCTVCRQAPTSDRVELRVTGDWWKGNFGLAENTLEGTCRIGQEEIPLTVISAEDGYTATATVEGLAYDKAYGLSLSVKDRLMEQTLFVTVNPGMPVFDWGQKDFAFHVPVTLSDGAVAISENRLRQLLTDWGLLDP